MAEFQMEFHIENIKWQWLYLKLEAINYDEGNWVIKRDKICWNCEFLEHETNGMSKIIIYHNIYTYVVKYY